LRDRAELSKRSIPLLDFWRGLRLQHRVYDSLIILAVFVCAIVLCAVAEAKINASCYVERHSAQLLAKLSEMKWGFSEYVPVDYPSPEEHLSRDWDSLHFFGMFPVNINIPKNEAISPELWPQPGNIFGPDGSDITTCVGNIARFPDEFIFGETVGNFESEKHSHSLNSWGRSAIGNAFLELPSRSILQLIGGSLARRALSRQKSTLDGCQGLIRDLVRLLHREPLSTREKCVERGGHEDEFCESSGPFSVISRLAPSQPVNQTSKYSQDSKFNWYWFLGGVFCVSVGAEASVRPRGFPLSVALWFATIFCWFHLLPLH
jgi:hypothetical protein